jgi:NTE family protein
MDNISRLSHQDKLKRISFFKDLPAEMLSALAEKLRHEHYRQGDVVVMEGEDGDSLYFIDSGQVQVSVGSGVQGRIVNYLGPGNFFGELALLLNQKRAATITVVIDADFWVLRKHDLDELLERFPSSAILISRELSRRLTDSLRRPVREERYSPVVVVDEQPWLLAQRLVELTGERVTILNLSGHPLVDGIDVSLPDEVEVSEGAAGLRGQEVAELLGVLADTENRILVSVAPEPSEASAKVVELARAAVIVHHPAIDWIERDVGGPVWRCSKDPREIERVARHIARRTVGLALSSGGARGIAHIGVLRVLEQEDIPVDVVAGTSAGALFGAMFALGASVDEIAEFALRFHNDLSITKLLDFSVPPQMGLIRGQRFLRYLERLYDGATFADTRVPFYVVAADGVTGEEVVFDSGSIADAVRASTSIVGVLVPHEVGGRYLVDGGAVNPLPVSVLADRGADILVASRAIPSLEDELEYRRSVHSPEGLSILGLLSNFQSIMEREIIKNRLGLVDVIVFPKVEAYTAMDYRHASEFIRMGEEAAKQSVGLIKGCIYARA